MSLPTGRDEGRVRSWGLLKNRGETGRQHITGDRDAGEGLTPVISGLLGDCAILRCPLVSPDIQGSGRSFPRQQKGRPQAALDTLYRNWLWFLMSEENREGTPDAAEGASSPQEERQGRHSS
jgi:hypothetical protein